MRLDLLPSPILFYHFLAAAPARALVQTNFSTYPDEAQQCLYDAASKSRCTGDTVTQINACLCGDTNDFVTNAAYCIWISYQSTDLMGQTYKTLLQSCSVSRTPLDVSQAQFFDAANGKLASTLPAASATSSTGSGQADERPEVLPAGAKAAIIGASVATAMVLCCVTVGIALFVKRRRAKRRRLEGEPDKLLLNSGLNSGGITPSLRSPALSGQSTEPGGPAQVWRPGDGRQAVPRELLLGRDLQTSAYLHQGDFVAMPERSATLRSDGSWVASPEAIFAHDNMPGARKGTVSTLASISRRATDDTISSWARQRAMQDGPYELPGIEAQTPVEADSRPINISPDRLSLSTSHAPPIYKRGDWNDPITDKPI